MEDKEMEFQEMLLKVQESLSQVEVQELAFLCTDLLGRRDLSKVATAGDLFLLLKKEDLLSSDDCSLLMELLKTTKRYSLLKELNLSQQLVKRISPFRQMLFELAEETSEEDLKNIKFLLHKNLPPKNLKKDTTLLQLFLDLEKFDFLGADNLDTIEKIVGCVHPSLQTTINQFKASSGSSITAQETTWKNEIGSQDVSVTTRPVQVSHTSASMYQDFSNMCQTSLEEKPEFIPQNVDIAYDVHTQGLESQHPYNEVPTSLSSLSGDNVEGQMSHLNLNERSHQGSSQVQSQEDTRRAEEKTQTSPGPEDYSTFKLEEYKMEGDRRGVCLIINNHDFSKSKESHGNRDGTYIDEKSLIEVFQWLGFEPKVARDCSRKRMLKEVKNLSSYEHTQNDCVVFCVLTHGYEGGVYGVDGEKVELRELMEPLNGHHCPSLSQKPKLFFIQACQGTQEQQVVFLNSDGPDDSREMGIVCDALVPKESIPSDADFLMAMSTVPNYVSYRETKRGTWFIQTLCENLKLLVPRRIDLLSILTKVNYDVSRKTDKSGIKKQIPQPKFTLRNKVVFPVPNSPPPP